MAKIVNSAKYTRALLNLDNMTLTEEDKNGIYVYSLLDTLRRFDGAHINLSLVEEVPMEQAQLEEDENEEE